VFVDLWIVEKATGSQSRGIKKVSNRGRRVLSKLCFEKKKKKIPKKGKK
jgi:hypothetical protein